MTELVERELNGLWKFPNGLYGTHNATRRWWRTILKRAWNAGSWSIALDNKSMTDVRDTIGDIVFEVTAYGVLAPHRSNQHWFLSWCADDRPYDEEAIQDDPAYLEIVAKDQELLKRGLRYLWFTIAHLGGRVDLPQLFGSPQHRESSSSLFLSILQAICFWLPEISSLQDRLTKSGFLPNTALSVGQTIPLWLISLRQNFSSAGFKTPIMTPEWEELRKHHKGDPLTFLLMLELIEEDSGRYRPSRMLSMRAIQNE